MTTPPIPAFEARRPVSDLDYVYDALKQSCMNGEFTPGQKVTLPQLAEAFGTSQMPIREATNRLIAAKAMEAPPRRSLRIPEATLARLDELLPLRLLLEGEATRLAAAQGAALADALTGINAEMPRHAAAEDLKAYLNANQRFHFTLYAAAGNANLLDMIELLTNAANVMAEKAIRDFTVNTDTLDAGVGRNPVLVTALNPEIGYTLAADIAKEAYRTGRPVIDVAEERSGLSRGRLEQLMNPLKLTRGGIT